MVCLILKIDNKNLFLFQLRACGMVMLYSYVFGLLLCTTVELPVAAVIRRLQGRDNRELITKLNDKTYLISGFKKSKKTLNTSSNGTAEQDKLKTS